jgi:hypothetical protein
MKREIKFDLMRDLLDLELIDRDQVSCGMVDDVELSMGRDGPTITALWVGAGAWQRRLPALVRVIARTLCGSRRRRVAFEEVMEISDVVCLKSTASELGLGAGDRKAGRWLAKWEKSQ